MLVGIVDVKHVNPVQPKPSQALLDRSHDPVVGEVIGGIDGRYTLVCLAWLRWGVRPEKAPDLGREDELFTGLRSQHRAQALLGEAVAVEGRGVKETYACLPGGLDHAMRFIVGHLFEQPAERRAAEAEARYVQRCLAELGARGRFQGSSAGRAHDALQIKDLGKPVAALAAEVVRLRHHRGHLRLPADVHRIGGQLCDRAIVVVALDVVKQVEAVAKDHVLADADPLDRLQHVGPHRPVVLLVALLGARFESRMEADLHQAEWPARRWPRSQRSPLALGAARMRSRLCPRSTFSWASILPAARAAAAASRMRRTSYSSSSVSPSNR